MSSQSFALAIISSMTSFDLDLSKYDLGWSDSDVEYAFKPSKGLDQGVVDQISWWKGEPEWMLDLRLKGLRLFGRKPLPAIPPRPERDLLWFIAHYAPELEGWERDIFLAVREESFYFYPVFACQIMNEGWASYWHARLLREADFLPSDLYVEAVKAHSDVVRPFAADHQLSLAINPYHLGFSIWEDLIERRGLAFARQVMRDEDDFSFVRNYLSVDLAERLDLFVYEADHEGGIRIAERDIHAIREAILAPRFNYGAPRIAVKAMHVDGSLELVHDHEGDGRGLDLTRAERVLDYIARVWRRPVSLQTVGTSGNPRVISSTLSSR